MLTVSFKEPEPAVLLDHNYECNASIDTCSFGLSAAGNDMATLGVKLSDEDGRQLRTVREYLTFNSEKTEWKLSEVFHSLSMAKNTGDQVEVSTDSLIGRTGRVRVIQDTYTDKSGDEQLTNKIGRWLAPQNTDAPQ